MAEAGEGGGQPLSIDVILRTHNRAGMLADAVASFFAADRSGIAARLLVVDNASSDGTADLLRELATTYGPSLVGLFEPKPGGQHALNCGLAHASADIAAFFDDDERIDGRWLQVIRREFADPSVDYIAGPVRPLGDPRLPEWLPPGFGGVLGIIDSSPQRRLFEPGFAAMLTQGNCALRRRIFDQTGPYPAELPTAEDRWLNQWLVARARRGFYCPDFVVDHVMQVERITPSYFRDWARREGRDLAVCDRLDRRPSVLRQRWYWRHLGRCVLARFSPGIGRPERFGAELNLRVACAYAREMITARLPG